MVRMLPQWVFDSRGMVLQVGARAVRLEVDPLAHRVATMAMVQLAATRPTSRLHNLLASGRATVLLAAAELDKTWWPHRLLH